jgi:hypothetical protein
VDARGSATTLKAAVSSTAPAALLPSTVPAATTIPDPFTAYRQLIKEWDIIDAAPKDLTPDEARARALLGCQRTWPPKTVDAALAQAYSKEIAAAKVEGHCT